MIVEFDQIKGKFEFLKKNSNILTHNLFDTKFIDSVTK